MKENAILFGRDRSLIGVLTEMGAVDENVNEKEGE